MAGQHKWDPQGAGLQAGQNHPTVFFLAWAVVKHVKKATGIEVLKKEVVLGTKTADTTTSRAYSEVRAMRRGLAVGRWVTSDQENPKKMIQTRQCVFHTCSRRFHRSLA
jgi:hypothetical protein